MVLSARLLTLTVLCTALSGCGLLKVAPTAPPPAAEAPPPAPEPVVATPEPADTSSEADLPAPQPVALTRKKSRWVPVEWHELPGFGNDSPEQAWDSWLHSCSRPPREFARLCGEVRQQRNTPDADRLEWMKDNLQPYRVETLRGNRSGLLTGYFEPTIAARRQRDFQFRYPVYRQPATLKPRKRWYSRREMDTLPAAMKALKGHAIAWLSSPVEILMLQTQGNAVLRITEPDESTSYARLQFANTNMNQAASAGKWLQARGEITNTNWDTMQEWVDRNPQRGHELLWANPQVVFFREQPVVASDLARGPQGAHGVPLTARRSIAVDRDSIPFGTPVWMASTGTTGALKKLVFAQDTGGGIQGAVRADFYVGSGKDAGELASRIRQPLQLWVLWPKPAPLPPALPAPLPVAVPAAIVRPPPELTHEETEPPLTVTGNSAH